MRRLITAIGVLIALLAAGCGSDSSAPDSTATETTGAVPVPPSSASPAPLDAGTTYRSTIFKPTVQFTLPPGDWETASAETPRSIAIGRYVSPTRKNVLALVHIDRVFDPQRGGTGPSDAIDAPDDFATFLLDHPRLKASAPESAEVAGQSAQRIDVEVMSAPSRTPAEACAEGPCLPLYLDGRDPVVFRPGDRVRYYVFDGPDGQLVAELYVSPAEHFDSDVKSLDEALASVQISG